MSLVTGAQPPPDPPAESPAGPSGERALECLGDGGEQRWAELADLLVDHSVVLRPGERVAIAMTEPSAYPLALAVWRAAVRRGAYPQLQVTSEWGRDALLREGDDDQVAWVPELEEAALRWADVYIGLRGGFPLDIHDSVSDDRLAASQRAQGVVSSLRWTETRWVLVRVPDLFLATAAGMSEQECHEMFFAACLVNWRELAARQQRWADWLAERRTIRITGRETDLSFSVAGRRWVSSAGRINMPDGEVFTAPVTGTEHGTIWFENAAVLGGRRVEGMRLTWDNGTLVEASAESGGDFLARMLASDGGARQIGEFAIGTNTGLTRFVGDILYDEKIGGTCHIALGRAYPECGGTNASVLHWDIVKDIRATGAVYADGDVVMTGGQVQLP